MLVSPGTFKTATVIFCGIVGFEVNHCAFAQDSNTSFAYAFVFASSSISLNELYTSMVFFNASQAALATYLSSLLRASIRG